MATTSGASPYQRDLEANTEPAAADVSLATVIGESPIAGIVGDASFTPSADITGAATNSRTFTLINKGTDGNGTTAVATLAMLAGVDATDFNELAITLSGTAADLVVAEGDVLAWTSTAVGTGIADPGGKVKVEIERD